MGELKLQKEADEVFDFLVQQTIQHIGVEKKQAEKRIRRLLDSGELDGLTPDQSEFAMIVDSHMTRKA